MQPTQNLLATPQQAAFLASSESRPASVAAENTDSFQSFHQHFLF
jgi:hypothetical protein